MTNYSKDLIEVLPSLAAMDYDKLLIIMGAFVLSVLIFRLPAIIKALGEFRCTPRE